MLYVNVRLILRNLDYKVFMSLRLLTEREMESFVMPAWMAGIQVCGMRPETSMSVWIPALHAGMTQSRDST
jgi:hypothetical protein